MPLFTGDPPPIAAIKRPLASKGLQLPPSDRRVNNIIMKFKNIINNLNNDNI
jgi:hypothetical protein